MKKYYLFLFFASLLFLAQCAKQEFEIGREDPELEIQKCVALSKRKVYDKAVECLEIFKSRFSESHWGQEAELRIADTHFKQHQYLMAAETYNSFIQLYPSHPRVDYAVYRKGLSYLKESPKAIDRDQKHLKMAIDELTKLVRYFPTSDYLEVALAQLNRAEERMAHRLLYIGRFYYRTGEFKATIPRLLELNEKYPKFSEMPRVLFYLSSAHLKLDQTEEARQAVQSLVENYPNNPWTKKAQERYLKKIH